jgi:hypothetical protein
MNLREIFGNNVSSSAFKLIDGELTLIGKWCRIALDDDGKIDLWICNTADMLAGLGVRKVGNIVSRINYRVGSPLRELNGEAWGKVRDKEIILQNLPLLGIKKKRRVSELQRVSLVARLRGAL